MNPDHLGYGKGMNTYRSHVAPTWSRGHGNVRKHEIVSTTSEADSCAGSQLLGSRVETDEVAVVGTGDRGEYSEKGKLQSQNVSDNSACGDFPSVILQELVIPLSRDLFAH